MEYLIADMNYESCSLQQHEKEGPYQGMPKGLLQKSIVKTIYYHISAVLF